MSGEPTSEIYRLLQDQALSQGFALCGAVDLDEGLAHPFYLESVDRFERWLGRGAHGTMAYLSRGFERRKDPRLLLPSAQSIFLVLDPYERRPVGETDPEKGVRYARYLSGPDYHESIKGRLEQVLISVSKSTGQNFESKICVDTSAVLERTWAAMAGLGWIGKNTLLIHPQFGSYHFIGAVLLSVKLKQPIQLRPNFCGSCVRCLEGCPTSALSTKEGLNSPRCLSYLTLENRTLEKLPEDLASTVGNWVAGCDICQEVCPFNTKPTKAALTLESEPSRGAAALSRWEDLLAESIDQYKLRTQESSLQRVKPHFFQRNLRWIKSES